MWKKIFIALLSLVGTFSVVFALNKDMKAEGEALLKVGDVFALGTGILSGAREPMYWYVIEVKGNSAIVVFNGMSYLGSSEHPYRLTSIGLSCEVSSTATCLTNGYTQNQGELYEFMHGAGIPSYGDGKTAFVPDYLNSLLAVNSLKIGDDAYSFETGFYSEPYIMTLEDYNSIDNKAFAQITALNSRGILLATAYDSTSVYRYGPKGDDRYAAPIGSSGLSRNITGKIWNADVSPVMKLDLTKLQRLTELQLTYTATPQNSLTTYEYSKNVAKGAKVGEVAYVIAPGTPTFSIIANPTAPSGHENDYLNFELDTNPTSSPVDVTIKNDAPNLVKGSLKAGTYYFRITGTDENGKPDPAPYQDVVLTVDKTSATISFNDTSLKNMNIGEATFTDSITTSNTDTLKSTDITYTLTGGTTGAVSVGNNSDYLKYDISVPESFDSSGLPSSSVLSAKLKETDNFLETITTVNRTIKVSKGIGELTYETKKASFTPGDVSSANTTVGTVKVSTGIGPFVYELVKTTDDNYDPVTGADNANFSLSDTPTVLNTALDVKNINALTEIKTYHVQFKVTDTASSEVTYATGTVNVGLLEQTKLDFKDALGGNVITTTGKKIKYNTTTETLIAEGGSSGVNIEYTALPQAQQPSTIDPDSVAIIDKASGSITPKHVGTIKVMAKRPGNTTYSDVEVVMELTIEPVEQEVSFNNTDDPIKVAIDDTTLVDAKGTIKDDGSNGVGTITYTSSDPSIATVDENGNVKGVSAGNVTITAVLNDKNKAGYNSDYEEASATKKIQVYKKMTLTWADVSPLLKGEDNAVGDKAGTISVKDNASIPTYAISTNTTDENADASFFHVVGSGVSAELTLAKIISADDVESHGGIFKVQVDVTDKNSTETITIEVQVKDSENEIYFTEGGVKVTSLTKQFKENGNTFNLSSYSSNGGNVTYAVDTSDTSGTVSVTGTGVVTINKAGTGTVSAVVAAGGGYDGGTITMEVTITQGSQTIAFKDTTTIKRQFVADNKFSEGAELKETSKATASTRTITYTSNSPSICSIDENGEVTMLTKGTCDLTASNKDSDWVTTTTNKQVSLYDKMSATYTAVTPNLKAETNVVGDKVGSIQVSDHQTPPTYKISTNSTTENADASFFQVIGNGASADLKLAKKVSALDWVSHNGIFKVQVEVTDINGTETIDIVVNVDQAENTASFTEDGTKITALTKQYGENKNTFNLTSTSSNAGAVTYGVDTTDTSGTLSMSADGVVTVNKVGTGKVSAKIDAGGGYTEKTITMDITITLGEQSIDFKDTTTLNQAFTANGTFSDPAELKETKLNTVSKRTITYHSNDTSVCTVDDVGTVTMLSKGICDLDASNKDANWKVVTTNKKINLYDGMGVSFKQTENLQAEMVTTNAGAKAGGLTVNGGLDPKTFAISTATDAKNKDASLFQVNTTGVVSFKKAIKATDLVGKYNETKKVYELFVQLETTDKGNVKVTTDAIVEIKGAPLKAEFDTNGTGKISEVYGVDKTFTLDLSSNKGNGVPTYRLKNDVDMPNDVLTSVDASGLVTIQHANDPSFVGNPLMVEAVIPASNGYDEETIEVEVEITKASQPDFKFKTPNIKLGHGMSITPTFTGKLSSGTISMTSGNNAYATISGSDIKAKNTDGSVVITAIDSGDRDYKSSTPPATATVTINSEPAYNFIIAVPSATYGDSGLLARIVTNDANGANQVQTWSSSDPTIADVDADKNITIYKAGQVTISCTQTSTGEPSVTSTAILTVDPKPITITINDKEKYVGETMPTFDMTIPSGVLVGNDSISLPTFACVDGSKVRVQDTTPAGSYPITGSYPTGANPNYDITVTPGTLVVKQDASQASWFHLEGVTSGNVLDPTKWYNEDVKVVLDTAIESAGSYNEISLDKTVWNSTFITVTTEDEHKENVTFRINASDPTHPLAMSTPQPTTIKIDKTKPVIKSITGTQTNKDAISSFLNQLTFGKFFKPGTKVSIVSEDMLPSPKANISNIKEVAYEVYNIDKATGIVESAPLTAGLLTPDTTGKSEITLDDIGLYRVCAIATDHAGNKSTESCSDINIKKIDVDVDGDNKPDFVDPDGDGCPDINIVLGKDSKDNWIKLNVDLDGDGVPDMNIDSKGTGKADLNVDTDNDKKPDLNLVVLTKDSWQPTICVKNQTIDTEGSPEDTAGSPEDTEGSPEDTAGSAEHTAGSPQDTAGSAPEYCTGTNAKPLINVDTTNDNIPDININTTGEMKAEINIDKNNNGILDAYDYNLTTKLDVWVPEQDYTYTTFVYDTQAKLKAYANIVVENSEYPSINLDTNGDGLPDLNIDINSDNIPDVEIDGDGDGIADLNLDPKGTGTPQSNIVNITEWKPELPFTIGDNFFVTMSLKGSGELEDNGIKVEKPDGSKFLPNFALKTEDITKTITTEDKEKIESLLSDNDEIKQVFNVSLFNGNTSIQPDGMIRVKIPVVNGLTNPKLVITQKDGTHKVVDAIVENGYYVYETDYLGIVSVIGDKVQSEPDPIPTPNPTPDPDNNANKEPDSSVKGDYISNVGGASTGDESNVMILLGGVLISSYMLLKLRKASIKKK